MRRSPSEIKHTETMRSIDPVKFYAKNLIDARNHRDLVALFDEVPGLLDSVGQVTKSSITFGNFEFARFKDDFREFQRYLESLPLSDLGRIYDEFRNRPLGVVNTTNEKKLRYLSSCAFTHNKTDSTPDTNEDAYFSPIDTLRIEGFSDPITFAIADGATSSPDARTWAGMLVNESSKYQSKPENLISGMKHLRATWAADWDKRKTQQLAATSAWWTAQALDKPTAATYCSLTVENPNWSEVTNLNWRAMAVGDSCLFQFRAGCQIKAFPIDDLDGFTDHPLLVRSSGCETDLSSDSARIQSTSGVAKRGDTFILATDAMAEWLLRHLGSNEDLKNRVLLATKNTLDFTAFIDKEREAGRIKDDDSTLVIVGVR